MKVTIQGTIIVYLDGVDIEQARLRDATAETKSLREIVEEAAHRIARKRNPYAVLVKSDIRGMSNATVTFRIENWNYNPDSHD